jgi:hypothetical protein
MDGSNVDCIGDGSLDAWVHTVQGSGTGRVHGKRTRAASTRADTYRDSIVQNVVRRRKTIIATENSPVHITFLRCLLGSVCLPEIVMRLVRITFMMPGSQ